MTWGLPSNNNGQADQDCLSCSHINACRIAIQARQPVACEGTDRAYNYGNRSRCASVLRPGAEFTRLQLAALANVAEATADYWIKGQRQKGAVVPIGQIINPNKMVTTIYRYSP